MNPIYLSEINQPLRIGNRPKYQQQDTFNEEFDSEIFIYDIFSDLKRTYLIGPPSSLDVWNHFFQYAKFDRNKVSIDRVKIYKNKIDKVIINQHFNSLEFKGFSTKIRKNSFNTYKNVLYSLQKNNHLLWIKDWIEWYKNNHKIDCVILYDNNSDIYDIEELRTLLNSFGLKSFVEAVPYKYGPSAHNGSFWDSDFLQYAMFEHVRYFYCNNNAKLINSDIDELIFINTKRTIFDFIKKQNTYISIEGKWLDFYQLPGNNKLTISHKLHNILNKHDTCLNKWAINLDGTADDVFLRVHEIKGCNQVKITYPNLFYLHHRCISNNWKSKREPLLSLDTEKHCFFNIELFKKYS